jgi:hypothetical protein
MRSLAGVVFAIGVLAATPSLADCDHAGQMAAEGARVCQGGVVSVCSAHEWLATTLTCPLQPNDPTAPLITPMAQTAVIHILTARYSAGQGTIDFVFALRQLCDGRQTCVVPPDLHVQQGDPAVRQRGSFIVQYACVAGLGTLRAQQAVFDNSAAQTLSCRE